MESRARGERAIRVLMLAKGLGRGGTERLIVETARCHDRSRFSVEVAYLLPHKDQLAPELAGLDIPVHCLDGSRPIDRWVPRLRHLVRTGRFDVVHTHMPLTAAIARLAVPGRRPVFIHTEHNVWQRYRRATRWANRATYRRNTQVIAVSAEVARSIRSRVPVEVVRHGIDVPSVEPDGAARLAARAMLGLAPGDAVIGTVGSFTAKKNHELLLRAVSAISRDLPDVQLVLVGTGPMETSTRAVANRLGLAERSRFVGSRGDVRDLLPAFDVFALSSRFEGLPIALLEAMAMGVPCVATSVGGVPEVVTHGADGLLVESGDEVGLSAALSKLVTDEKLRTELGSAGRRRAQEFRSESAVRAIESVYSAAVGRS